MEIKNNEYLPGLDHIRAFAAIFIVIQHSFWSRTLQPPTGIVMDYSTYDNIFSKGLNFFMSLVYVGNISVTLFMVLSGFIFYKLTYKKEIVYWSFIKNRILRIYPLYIFFIVVGLSMYPGVANINNILFLVLPLSSLNYIDIHPYNSVTWAISVEFIFYFIFPFLMKSYKPKDFFRLILILILFRLFAFIIFGKISQVSYGTIFGRLDQFLIGMLTAHIYITRENKLTWKNKFLLVLSFFLMTFVLFRYLQLGGYAREVWWKSIWTDVEGLVCAMFIYFYLMTYNVKNKFLNTIGKYSFSIYLSHMMLIFVFRQKHWYFKFTNEMISNEFLNVILLILPTTIFLSYLTYSYIEEPFLKMRVKYIKDVEN